MKEETRRRLRDSALSLFSSGWYEDVSVAGICRTAGLSNGIFYFYYPDKEAIFLEILEDSFATLEQGFTAISGNGKRERFESFYKVLIAVNTGHRRHLSVFRQGLMIFPRYEERLVSLFRKYLEPTLETTVTTGMMIYLMAGIRFLTYRSISTGLPLAVDSFLELMWNGVFTVGTEDFLRIFREEIREIPEEKDSKTVRERIIRAGSVMFMEQGFHGVNVHEIADSLGISIGSFYFHIHGKGDLESAVIMDLGHRLRRFINLNVGIRISRFEQELRGWHLFVEFFRNNPRGYRLIREAEFVVPETIRDYYDRLEAGYVKNLRDLRTEDRVTAANFLLGIANYVGVYSLFLEPETSSYIAVLESLSRCLIDGIGGAISG